ncbi:Iron ABC transporter permease [Sphingomonas antarctica]
MVIAAALLALAIAAWRLTHGPLAVPLADLFDSSNRAARLALDLRAPRLLTALAAGAALAGAGAALQTMFRNPLVAPDLLGVSSGAAVGAAGALLLGLSAIAAQVTAFGGGIAAAALALACARLARGSEPRLALVLCGIVTGALMSAALAAMLFLADPYSQLPAITFWLLGSFGRATLSEAVTATSLASAGLTVLLWLGFRLDVLSLGDDQAHSLGVTPRPLRFAAIGAATLATSAMVAVAGIVGWIGLIAPHLARLIVGERIGALLPAAIAIGALFGVLLDTAATSFGPVELPVGLLAAGLGAPAFLALFVARGGSR